MAAVSTTTNDGGRMPARKRKVSSYTAAERLARLEEQVSAFVQASNSRHSEYYTKFSEIEKSQDDIKLALSRYKGFWGGIMLVGGAIMTCLTVFAGFLRQKLFGN